MSSCASNTGSIEERLKRLQAVLDGVRCEDKSDHRTELRKRTVTGGAVHYVRQCLRCGSQVGGPERRPVEEIKDFDLEIVTRYDDAYRQYNQLLLEQMRATLPDNGDPLSPTEARTDVRNKIASSFDDLLARMSEIDGKATAMQIFRQRMKAVEKKSRDELAATTKRFTSEIELAAWLKKYLTPDFLLNEEVKGRHIAENKGVRIDFVAFPKQHLIDAGFEPGPFGIEVKFIDPMNGFSRKASRAFWQTITYTDSDFYVDGESVRLNFAMLFTNLGFEKENKLLDVDDVEQWKAFFNLAHHSKVARLQVGGDKFQCERWMIMFSSNVYFYGKVDLRTGERTYFRPNKNALRKIQRVGNF